MISQDDIDAMRANGYDPGTILEAENQLQHCARGSKIADRIRSAFSGVTLGKGVGLKESRGKDDYEGAETLAKYRANDEKDDWERIPIEELNNASGGLCFFDAEGMRFHLPAYLIADLRGEYNFGMDFNLTHLSEHCLEQFALVNREQRQCVRDFLIHILDDPDYGLFNNERIHAALHSYWTDEEDKPAEQGGDGDAEEAV